MIATGEGVTRGVGLSARAMARLAAASFLLTMVLGGLGESLQGRLVVPGDAAATAANIAGHETLLWAAFAAYMVEMSCQVAATVLFYELLRPVSRVGSLLGAGFALVGIVVKIVSRVIFVAPVLILGSASYLQAFGPGERQALALLAIRVNVQGTAVALIFFGVYAIVTGYLVFRSTFLPAVLGVLGMIGGLGWLTFLYPPLGLRLLSYVVMLALLGAVPKIGWMLVFGVREPEWRAQVSRSAASAWG